MLGTHAFTLGDVLQQLPEALLWLHPEIQTIEGNFDVLYFYFEYDSLPLEELVNLFFRQMKKVYGLENFMKAKEIGVLLHSDVETLENLYVQLTSHENWSNKKLVFIVTHFPGYDLLMFS